MKQKRSSKYPPLSNEELTTVLSRLTVSKRIGSFLIPKNLLWLQNTLHKYGNTDSKHIDDYLVAITEINRRVRILGLRE